MPKIREFWCMHDMTQLNTQCICTEHVYSCKRGHGGEKKALSACADMGDRLFGPKGTESVPNSHACMQSMSQFTVVLVLSCSAECMMH